MPHASASIANSGTPDFATNFSASTCHSSWIIDSGATDHMTCDRSQIHKIIPSKQTVICNANGTPTLVIGEGSVSLTSSLNLDSVLVVPSLNYNLLSVAQITAALQCLVIFWPDFCVFQDILTRATIGFGTRRGKLYYLNLAQESTQQLGQAYKIGGDQLQQQQETIWLWHKRLGHSSFRYLRKMFPAFFSNFSESHFKCDICELAKSHCVPFPLSITKSTVPFSLIHSDVWGPAKVAT